MPTSQLIRLGGLAAVVAGLLRGGASFFPFGEPTDVQELLYLAIDLSILFGLLGIYAYQNADAGRVGFVGFVLAIAGTAMITGPDGTLGGVQEYVVGVLLIGGPCTARHRGVAGREAPTIRTGAVGDFDRRRCRRIHARRVTYHALDRRPSIRCRIHRCRNCHLVRSSIAGALTPTFSIAHRRTMPSFSGGATIIVGQPT